MDEEKRSALLQAVTLISDFLDERPCGETYWVDYEDEAHSADIGYVNEFLMDLEAYLKGEWESQDDRLAKIYPPKYHVEIILKDKDSARKDYNCQTYNIFNGQLSLIINPFSIKRRNLDHMKFCKITRIDTGEVTFEFNPERKNGRNTL